MSEHAARHLSARNSDCQNKTVVKGKSLSVPLCSSGETSPVSGCDKRKPLIRTRSGVPDCTYGPNRPLDTPMQCYMLSPQNPPPCSQMSDIQAFPKSHSIENICRETYNHTNNIYQPLWSRQMGPQGCATIQQAPCATPQEADDGTGNLHKKLQRQLTLNPAGCDPRIYQLQRVGGCNQQQAPQQLQQPCQPQQQQQQQSAKHHSPHRPLAPALSGPRTHHPSQWDLHQVRI